LQSLHRENTPLTVIGAKSQCHSSFRDAFDSRWRSSLLWQKGYGTYNLLEHPNSFGRKRASGTYCHDGAVEIYFVYGIDRDLCAPTWIGFAGPGSDPTSSGTT
jgi:hypothetical protein